MTRFAYVTVTKAFHTRPQHSESQSLDGSPWQSPASSFLRRSRHSIRLHAAWSCGLADGPSAAPSVGGHLGSAGGTRAPWRIQARCLPGALAWARAVASAPRVPVSRGLWLPIAPPVPVALESCGTVGNVSSTHAFAAVAQTTATRDAALCRRVFMNQGRSAGYITTTGSLLGSH